MSAHARRTIEPTDKVLAAAGGFTGLWALTWLGAEAAGMSAAVDGCLAVGSVMGASGLTVLWWKTRALRLLHEAAAAESKQAEAEREGLDETSAQPSRAQD